MRRKMSHGETKPSSHFAPPMISLYKSTIYSCFGFGRCFAIVKIEVSQPVSTGGMSRLGNLGPSSKRKVERQSHCGSPGTSRRFGESRRCEAGPILSSGHPDADAHSGPHFWHAQDRRSAPTKDL